MNYKGHFDILKDASNHSKAQVLMKEGDNDVLTKEYIFENGKVIKIIDFLNGIISQYDYFEVDKFEVSFFRFENDVEEKNIDSIKVIKTKNGLEINETLFEFNGDSKIVIYKSEKEYDDWRIVSEVYNYPDFDYKIEHCWNKAKTKLQTIYPNGDGKYRYQFDNKGYLIEFLEFKHEGYCKKILYEYKNGNLSKMKEYPQRPYKQSLFGNKIKFLNKPDFIHETSFRYQGGSNLIEQESKKDIVNDHLIDVTTYKYEK